MGEGIKLGFVVYNPTTRVISSAPRTQAEANVLAAANDDLSADTVDRALPILFAPGGWFFTTSSEIVSQLPLSDIDRLKEAARACHRQLITWSHLLTEAAITHSASDAQIGHDILFHGHEGVYVVCNNLRPAGDTFPTLTIAQRITFCQQTAYGASDVTNPEEFFQEVEHVRDSVFDSPVVWVDPNLGTRIGFTNIHGSTGNILNSPQAPSSVLLGGGSWIESLAA